MSVPSCCMGAQSRDPENISTSKCRFREFSRCSVLETAFSVPNVGSFSPARIHLLNQSNLLRAPPALDLFFPRNSQAYVLNTHVMKQAVAFVLTGEALALTCFVLLHAAEVNTFDANLHRAGEARQMRSNYFVTANVFQKKETLYRRRRLPGSSLRFCWMTEQRKNNLLH